MHDNPVKMSGSGEQPRGRMEWCEGVLVGGVELV